MIIDGRQIGQVRYSYDIDVSGGFKSAVGTISAENGLGEAFNARGTVAIRSIAGDFQILVTRWRLLSTDAEFQVTGPFPME